MILYRPVGLKEAELIGQSKFTAFPPRLPIQPIFYPVLNFEYAAQIAREWNTKDPVSGFVGFVTEFEVEDKYVGRFDTHVVGSNRTHLELWVPSEEMADLTHILLALSKSKQHIMETSFVVTFRKDLVSKVEMQQSNLLC